MTVVEFLMEHLDKLPADERFVLLRSQHRGGRSSLSLGVSRETRNYLYEEARRYSEALTKRYGTTVTVTVGAVMDWLVAEKLDSVKRKR